MISLPSPSMNIQIVGGKITENLGFESQLRRVKIFLSLLSFHFQILHTKLGILTLTIFFISCIVIRNQIKYVENVCSFWYLICKTKMVKNNDMQFFMENLKMNKVFLTFWSWDSNPRFSLNFPTMIWMKDKSSERMWFHCEKWFQSNERGVTKFFSRISGWF